MTTISDLSESLARRAAIHAALGDPHRLAIVDALMRSDRAPSELGSALAIPSNLLAHHLAILEHAGVVARTVSQGDGRRRYVRLEMESLDLLLGAPALFARAVLFVCHHNSARSLMAQALWTRASPIPADSAGFAPAAKPDPRAVSTAARHQLDIAGARPKGYDAVMTAPDIVISVCDRTREDELPAAALHLHWSVPDPVASSASTAFEDVFAQLDRRVAAAARLIRPAPIPHGA